MIFSRKENDLSKETHLDEVKTFYDPHPGFAGAAIPIPGPVKAVADQLDGKTMTLREAIAALQAATRGKVYAVPEHSYIALHLGDDTGRYAQHLFRVIKYR